MVTFAVVWQSGQKFANGYYLLVGVLVSSTNGKTAFEDKYTTIIWLSHKSQRYLTLLLKLQHYSITTACYLSSSCIPDHWLPFIINNKVSERKDIDFWKIFATSAICKQTERLLTVDRIVHHKMVDNKEFNMNHMNKLADWLSRLHSSFRDGNMVKTLQEMPDYYRVIDSKVGKIIPCL